MMGTHASLAAVNHALGGPKLTDARRNTCHGARAQPACAHTTRLRALPRARPGVRAQLRSRSLAPVRAAVLARCACSRAVVRAAARPSVRTRCLACARASLNTRRASLCWPWRWSAIPSWMRASTDLASIDTACRTRTRRRAHARRGWDARQSPRAKKASVMSLHKSEGGRRLFA
eukprot:6180543-Pleurochrysis_carterae.AAC.5